VRVFYGLTHGRGRFFIANSGKVSVFKCYLLTHDSLSVFIGTPKGAWDSCVVRLYCSTFVLFIYKYKQL